MLSRIPGVPRSVGEAVVTTLFVAPLTALTFRGSDETGHMTWPRPAGFAAWLYVFLIALDAVPRVWP